LKCYFFFHKSQFQNVTPSEIGCTSYCISSVIQSQSPISNRAVQISIEHISIDHLVRDVSFATLRLKKTQCDWDWRLRLNNTRNAVGCTANLTWGDILKCRFKAESSKLERLFCHVSVERDVRALSFQLSNSIQNCPPTLDGLQWNVVIVRALSRCKGSLTNHKREWSVVGLATMKATSMKATSM